jgi:glutaminyl-tRNA synthetase
MLEFCIRELLNKTAQRRMAVLRPLKVVIENYPEGQVEELEAVNHPDDPAAGTRKIRSAVSSISSKTISWRAHRRNSSACRRAPKCGCATPYFIKCTDVIKNAAGEVVRTALYL